MPELPEVETIARQLDAVLPGRVVAEVEVRREKSAQSDLSVIVGREVERIWRRAKYILIKLPGTSDQEQDELVLMVHLKMTGQLVWRDAKPKFKVQSSKFKANESQGADNLDGQVVGGHPTEDWVNELPSSHTRIILRFEDGSRLYFNDMRVFGWMKIVTSDKLQETQNDLPPDVIDPEFTVAYLREVLTVSSQAVKLVILDQQKIGGMGNIYANDALFLAGVHPLRPAKTLTAIEATALHAAMVEVIRRGIELGGASYNTYVDLAGMGGSYQEHFAVYDKEGDACPRKGCRGVIQKIKVGNRGTYFCPECQH